MASGAAAPIRYGARDRMALVKVHSPEAKNLVREPCLRAYETVFMVGRQSIPKVAGEGEPGRGIANDFVLFLRYKFDVSRRNAGPA